MTDIRETRSFKTKKWVLFAICLIYILLMMTLLLNSDYSVEYAFKQYYQTNTKNGSSSFGSNIQPEDAKNYLKAILRISALVIIIIEFFGLIGAYKENRCLTLTYAILMSISTFLNIVSFLISFKNFGSLLMSVGKTILAFTFYIDLKQVGTQLSAQPMFTFQREEPMPQTVIPMYATTVIGYQYPQQQQQQYNAGMGVYGGQPLPQQLTNYSNTPPTYKPNSQQNDYPTK